MCVAGGEPIPSYDAARIAAVRRYDILDSPPDGAFDRITALAARLFHVPIRLVDQDVPDRLHDEELEGLLARGLLEDLQSEALAALCEDLAYEVLHRLVTSCPLAPSLSAAPSRLSRIVRLPVSADRRLRPAVRTAR